MKKLLVCAAAVSCMLVVGSSDVMAQQCYSGGSGLGISLSYGNGYNNFGGSYNRGYSQPYYGGGYGGGGYYGGGYPAYRSVQSYSAPNYGGGYGGGSHLNHGGSYSHGFNNHGFNNHSGGFGGGYGHHNHH